MQESSLHYEEETVICFCVLNFLWMRKKQSEENVQNLEMENIFLKSLTFTKI